MKSTSGKRFVALFLVSTALVGCAQNGGLGQKESVGTGLGAGLGAIAGALLCKGNARVLCGAGGALIGGFVGNRIGASLDEKDKLALAEQSRSVLVGQADNSQINWSSDHSGATATIVPSNTRDEQRQVRVLRDAKVAPAPNLDLIGEKYQVNSSTNVRLAPSTDSEVAKTLPGGSNIWAVGKVRDKPWIMVAQNGRTIGYVTASNVSSTPKPSATTGSRGAQTANSAAYDLDAPIRTATDLDSLVKSDPTAKVDMVVASVTCRDLKTTASLNGQTDTSTSTACKSPDGSWELN